MPQPATSLKKRLWHRRFPVNLARFLRTSFLTEHLRQLLLKKGKIRDFSFSRNISDSIHRFLKNAVRIRLQTFIRPILLSLVCPIVLHKYDFNSRRVLNDLFTVDKVARMEAKIFAICDNYGRKVKGLYLNETFTKSAAGNQ